MADYNELQSLTTSKGTYDSFPDKEARERLDKAKFSSLTLETAQAADGDNGVILHPEGTAEAPALTLYGMNGDEPVQINNVAEATDDRSVPNLGQVKALLDGNGSGEYATLYIGPDEPAGDNRPTYWLDTSDSGDSDSGDAAEEYTITTVLDNVTLDNSATTVAEGESYAAAITPAEGFVLSSVSVTMGGVDITGTNYADGNIHIASVTGDVVITVSAIEETVTTYTITNSLVNVTSNNSAVSATENSAYTAMLTVADNYTLDAVTVTMGGVDVTADVYTDGVITIPAVTGDIVITAIGESMGIYTIPVDFVYHDSGLTGKSYSDNGVTELGNWIGATVYTAGVFSVDTRVRVTITLTNTIYSGLIIASKVSGESAFHYSEAVQTVHTYPTGGQEYIKEYTVRAGYHLAIRQVASTNVTKLEIMREDNGVTIE